LGLALSQQYARLLGGDIEMVSRVGKGSCFTVTILVMEAHPSEAISHQRNPRVKHLIAGTTAPRVLVVDDETDNRILMREFLVPVGFLVDLAEDGRVAVKKFKVGRPDLILMDVKMPVMGGERAIRAIRALKHGDEVKIIAVTASAFVEDRQKVLDWGADGYLRKPYKESELFEVIGKVLGTRYEYQPLEPAPEESHLLVAGSLGALPADLVSRMRTAAENIDYEGLEELIGIAATFSPVLAGRLLELLKRYEYETLGTLFAVRDGPLV
jgi:CheY-like chemotaxis protein